MSTSNIVARLEHLYDLLSAIEPMAMRETVVGMLEDYQNYLLLKDFVQTAGNTAHDLRIDTDDYGEYISAFFPNMSEYPTVKHGNSAYLDYLASVRNSIAHDDYDRAARVVSIITDTKGDLPGMIDFYAQRQ